MLFHVSDALYFITERFDLHAERRVSHNTLSPASARVGGFRGHALSSSKAYPIFKKMQIDLRVACPYIYGGDAPTHTHTYSHVTATMFPLTLGSGCIQSRLKCRFLIAWKPVCTVHRGRCISWRTLHCFILHSHRIVVRSCCMHAPACSYFHPEFVSEKKRWPKLRYTYLPMI